MFIDSHCHLNFPELSNRLDEVFDNMNHHKVDQALAVSVNKDTFKEIIQLIELYSFLYGSIGIHPENPEEEEYSFQELVDLSSHPKIIAIGETGLDYHWTKESFEYQYKRFKTHIKASKITNLPLIIHTRDAGEDTLRLFEQFSVDNAVIHCFTETVDFARAVLDRGLYISFSGIVTFKNAKEIQEVCRFVPDDRILIETDAPYLAPVPMRGKINEPAFVSYTAKYVAELRNQSVEHIAEITCNNFFNLFTKATDGNG